MYHKGFHATDLQGNGFLRWHPRGCSYISHDVTAQPKMWLDRFIPYLGSRDGVRDGVKTTLMGRMPSNKRVKFIFTQKQPDPELFMDHIKTFMNIVGLVGFDGKEYTVTTNLVRG